MRICDGHGYSPEFAWFTTDLDPRAQKVHVASRNPIRWEGLDETVHAFAMIGQHAMAGTVNAYLDHTQSSKVICRYTFNGEEGGEMSQMALYAGGVGAPLFYVSGDEALCAEAARLFPHAASTPTKRGTGWETCELYPTDVVRANIRRDIASALPKVDRSKAWRLPPPVEVSVEFAWSGRADPIARIPGVRRPHARTESPDVYNRPARHLRSTQSSMAARAVVHHPNMTRPAGDAAAAANRRTPLSLPRRCTPFAGHPACRAPSSPEPRRTGSRIVRQATANLLQDPGDPRNR